MLNANGLLAACREFLFLPAPAILLQLVMQGDAIDAEHFRGARLVPAAFVQHTQDVRLLDLFQAAHVSRAKSAPLLRFQREVLLRAVSGSCATTMARSTAFSSSRMLPGQLYCCSTSMAAGETRVIFFSSRAENLRDEVIDQQRDVFAALAQRRQLDVEDIQAVVKVGRNLPFLDQLLQVFVGRGHDSGNRP